MSQHSLRLHSAKELIASCSCGDWSQVVSMTTGDPTKNIRERVADAFASHLRNSNQMGFKIEEPLTGSTLGREE